MKRLAILIVALSLLSQNAYASVGCLTFKNVLKIGSNDPDVAGEVSKLQILALLPDESIYPRLSLPVHLVEPRRGRLSVFRAEMVWLVLEPRNNWIRSCRVKTAEKFTSFLCSNFNTGEASFAGIRPVIKVPVVQNILIDAP